MGLSRCEDTRGYIRERFGVVVDQVASLTWVLVRCIRALGLSRRGDGLLDISIEASKRKPLLHKPSGLSSTEKKGPGLGRWRV